MPPRKAFISEPGLPPGGSGLSLLALLGFILATALELLMLVLLFGTYAETMGMLSDVFLCDQPAIGRLFCVIDNEMTVSHLLALMLAIFSVAMPMVVWNEVIGQKIMDDPQLWISKPANRILAGIGLALLLLVFTLETVNIYTLIAREQIGGPFQTAQAPNQLMEFLAANQGLGIVVAGLVAVVNAALGFLAVRAAHSLKASLYGGL